MDAPNTLTQASVSSPTWERISFLNTNANGGITHFGVFGFTGSDTHIGYFFPGNIGYVLQYTLYGAFVLNHSIYSDGRLNGGLFHNFTNVLILIPIGKSQIRPDPLFILSTFFLPAAGLSGIAFIFGLCGFAYHRAGTVFMTLVSALALLATLIAWVIEMVLFGVARDHIRDRGFSAEFGNANWLVLGALVALILAFFTSACGIFGSYRNRRAAY